MHTDQSNDHQLDVMKELVQLSAGRSYMNAERTLSVWVRTALGAMIFGIAIDRFGIMILEMNINNYKHLSRHLHIMHVTGVVLVAYSMLIALLYTVRFLKFASEYKKKYRFPSGHGIWLSPFFAFLVVLFGIPLLFIMLWL